METVDRSAESDIDECCDVCAGRIADWLAVKMARIVDRCWVEFAD